MSIAGFAGVYKFPTPLKIAPKLLGIDQGGRRGMGMGEKGVHGGDREAGDHEGRVVLDVMLGLIIHGSKRQSLNATAAESIVDAWRRSLWQVDEQARDSLGRHVHDVRVASPSKIAVDVDSGVAGRVSIWLAEKPQGLDLIVLFLSAHFPSGCWASNFADWFWSLYLEFARSTPRTSL